MTKLLLYLSRICKSAGKACESKAKKRIAATNFQVACWKKRKGHFASVLTHSLPSNKIGGTRGEA